MKSKSFHKPEKQETTTGKSWGRWFACTVRGSWMLFVLLLLMRMHTSYTVQIHLLFASSVLLGKAIGIWKRYIHWRRYRKHEYATADEHFKSVALPKWVQLPHSNTSICYHYHHSHSYIASLIPIPLVPFLCHQYCYHATSPIPMLIWRCLCQVFCCHTRVCCHSTVQAHYPGESRLFQKVRNSPSSLPPIDPAGWKENSAVCTNLTNLPNDNERNTIWFPNREVLGMGS